jgi:XRE family transcriptional regulator, regulator of sulfur utilization
MPSDIPGDLARNIRQLRLARGFTQVAMAKLAGLPRATWSNLETGAANPTLSVLSRVAVALQVTIEELLSSPRTVGRFYAHETLPVRSRSGATLRRLLPDPLPGTEIDRMELEPGARLVGTPHTPGTHEYLTCESGRIELVASGVKFALAPGDVVAFRGDQRHSYRNPNPHAPAVGYSVVLIAPLQG